MTCGVGHRHGLDLALLWLRHRLVAIAPIQPLAWGPPYAMGAAQKSKKKKKKKITNKKNQHNSPTCHSAYGKARRALKFSFLGYCQDFLSI